MFRITLRDLIWFALLIVALMGWGYEHWTTSRQQHDSRTAQVDLAIAVQRQAELIEQMQQRLDEYENQHMLMRRLLRVAQQKRG